VVWFWWQQGFGEGCKWGVAVVLVVWYVEGKGWLGFKAMGYHLMIWGVVLVAAGLATLAWAYAIWWGWP